MERLITILLLFTLMSCSVSKKTTKPKVTTVKSVSHDLEPKTPINTIVEKTKILTPYEKAYQKIERMLKIRKYDFKEAVFTVENTFLDNTIDREQFDKQILFLSELSKQLTNSRELVYNFEDKEKVKKYASLFSVISDTISIQIDSNRIAKIPPYSYDFSDIWGHNDWSSMFVTKLLDTKQGNCHSMPYLYKILANEIGAEAHIAVAPNHFYIKHKNKASGWYNTELTSGIFPVDAWLMASGYIHLDAIVNKLYMEALSDKQSMALCMVDLAKGYQKKFGVLADNNFIIKCTNTALAYYPNYINALLLKVETKKKLFENIMVEHNTKKPASIFHIPKAKALFTEMSILYSKIHTLGYRKMPEEMYLKWLISLKEERSKYENKKITNFNTK